MTNIKAEVNRESSVSFMIAEYNSSCAEIRVYQDAKTSRVNFYLVIVAAVIASSAGLMDYVNITSLPIIITIAAFLLLLLGIAVLNQLIYYFHAMTSLYRRLGRIRFWFLKLDSEIKPYLPFEPRDDRPYIDPQSFYIEYRVGDVIVIIINAALASIGVLSIFYYFLPYLSSSISLPIGALIFLVSWFAQKMYLRFKVRRIDRYLRVAIRFSTDNLDTPKSNEDV
ncbi:MAG: hypothetical protein U9Q82_01685 [Chloroflexota bacterium]|nr:hypothetical protein [Chloroflexota bacterium]